VLSGTSSARARWRQCVDYSTSTMGLAVGRMFVEETFDESAKSKVRRE